MAYAKFDSRFANLAIFLKLWNKRLFKDRQCRLNSYSLNLMLIAFMQFEGILPSLQAAAKDKKYLKYEQQGKFLSYQSTSEVQFERDFDKVKMPKSAYELNEVQILEKFFHFYGHTFNESHLAIDIRSGDNPFPLRVDVLGEIKGKF